MSQIGYAALGIFATLTACTQTVAPSPDALRVAPPPAALTAPCADPQTGYEDIANHWASMTPEEQREAILRFQRMVRADRINLANCRDQHRFLGEWAGDVAEVFSGKP